MGSGIWILSAGRRRSLTSRALALTLGVITVLSGGLGGAMPVGATTSAPPDRDPAFRTGGRDALGPVFVAPTADAGDDQSVTEGNVVTPRRDPVQELQPGHADLHDLGRLRRGDLDQPDRHASRSAPPRRHHRGLRVHLDRRLRPRHRGQDRHGHRRRPRRVLVGARRTGRRIRRAPRSTTTATSGSATAPRPAASAAWRRAPSRRSASSRTASASTATATASSTPRPA